MSVSGTPESTGYENYWQLPSSVIVNNGNSHEAALSGNGVSGEPPLGIQAEVTSGLDAESARLLDWLTQPATAPTVNGHKATISPIEVPPQTTPATDHPGSGLEMASPVAQALHDRLLSHYVNSGNGRPTPPVATTRERRLIGANTPWSPTTDEAALPITEEMERLVTLGLHLATDERHLAVMGLLAQQRRKTPTSSLMDKLDRVLHPVPLPLTFRNYMVDRWLARNGLVEVTQRAARQKKEIELTEAGKALLPFMGHLIESAADPRYPRLAKVLGTPFDSRCFAPEEPPTPGRFYEATLRYIADHADTTIPVPALRNASQANDATAHVIKNNLQSVGWLIAVPGDRQAPERFPLLAEGLASYKDSGGDEFSNILLRYLKQQWEHGAPAETYDLTFNAAHPARSELLARVGEDEENFARLLFQEIARQVTLKHVKYARPASLVARNVAVNPGRLAAIRDLLAVIKGAGQNSLRYRQTGMHKLKKYSSNNDEIRHLFR